MAGFVGGSAANPVQLFRGVISASDLGPLPGGSFEDIIFDALDVNSHGGTPLNTGTGVFTVPAGLGGYWGVATQIYLFTMNPSAQYQLTIDKNGSLAAKTMLTADTAAHFMGATWLGELAAGDTVKATVKVAGSYALTMIDGNSAYSWIDFIHYPR